MYVKDYRIEPNLDTAYLILGPTSSTGKLTLANFDVFAVSQMNITCVDGGRGGWSTININTSTV